MKHKLRPYKTVRRFGRYSIKTRTGVQPYAVFDRGNIIHMTNNLREGIAFCEGMLYDDEDKRLNEFRHMMKVPF